MTKLEKLAVQQIYHLHCEALEVAKKMGNSTPEQEKSIKKQLEVIDDQIVELHDALITGE